MITETFSSLDVALGFFFIYLNITQSHLEPNFTPEEIGHCLEGSPFVNDPSYCKIVNFNLFADCFISLPILINSNNHLAGQMDVLADFLSPWHDVDTPELQSSKHSAFRKIVL